MKSFMAIVAWVGLSSGCLIPAQHGGPRVYPSGSYPQQQVVYAPPQQQVIYAQPQQQAVYAQPQQQAVYAQPQQVYQAPPSQVWTQAPAPLPQPTPVAQPARYPYTNADCARWGYENGCAPRRY